MHQDPADQQRATDAALPALKPMVVLAFRRKSSSDDVVRPTNRVNTKEMIEANARMAEALRKMEDQLKHMRVVERQLAEQLSTEVQEFERQSASLQRAPVRWKLPSRYHTAIMVMLVVLLDVGLLFGALFAIEIPDRRLVIAGPMLLAVTVLLMSLLLRRVVENRDSCEEWWRIERFYGNGGSNKIYRSNRSVLCTRE